MKNRKISKTKIICTLGPAVSSVASITRLISNGMDAVRLNFSHGTYIEHANYIRNLRSAETRTAKKIAVIQDLQGPKIRVGNLGNKKIRVKPKGEIILTTQINNDSDLIPVTYDKLHKDVKQGDKLYIDDGKIRIKIKKVVGKRIYCETLNSGEITSHKGINLPNVKINVPSLTEKDRNDTLFGLENGVDFIALSFVRSAEDVLELKDFIKKNNKKNAKKSPAIIAKIEKQEAIKDIDKIIKVSDGILIARGDLGIEMPIEDVPLLQKEIVKKCRENTKPVIVATQMLESMINNPLPTRAEVSDVANAVLDGVDAVLLSGETSIGNYPFQAVDMMNKIIFSAEKGINLKNTYNFIEKDNYDALAESAVLLSDDLSADAIVAITHSGKTAIYVAKYRPKARLLAFTESIDVARLLSISWGIDSFVVSKIKGSTDEVFKKIHEFILAEGILKKKNKYVVLAGLPLFEKNILNTIKVFSV